MSAPAVTWGVGLVSLPVLVFAGPPSADVLPLLGIVGVALAAGAILIGLT